MTTTNEAIARFGENEKRVDIFVNENGHYSTNEATPRNVKTLPSFMAELIERYFAFSIKGNWTTATNYEVKDLVVQSNLVYVCTLAHTSSTFAADLSSGKWAIYQGISPADLASQSGSNLVGHVADALGAVPTTVQEMLRRRGIDPLDFGAIGNGTADDLQALRDARNAAGAKGVPLILSKKYGISDYFGFADGGCSVVWFEPGAEIVLLGNTSVGGMCGAAGSETPTKPIYIFNATFDAKQFLGENAVSGVHPVGVTFYNLTIRNTLHETFLPWYGGKALQWEGNTSTNNAKVFGLNIENCTVGIDCGAPVAGNFTHIGIFGVSMKNVDIPFHFNDTNTSSISDSYDQVEVMIDGVQLRNCGKLTYPGSVSYGGGIVVQERGFKGTIRNVNCVNDRGGYGTTAYGGIGALVRGQGKGIVLENVLIDAHMTALFDFNPSSFQSPFVGDIASYVYASNIRHFGNLDFVVKCMPGGNKIGPGVMRGIEIGSAQATLAAILDDNAKQYNNSFVELIDRDNKYVTSGLLSFSDIKVRGNALTSAVVGRGNLALSYDEWTPVDGSSDALTFPLASGCWQRIGDMAHVWGKVTYPSNSGGGDARLGGLPFPPRDIEAVTGGGNLGSSTTDVAKFVELERSSNKFKIKSATGVNLTNSALSGHTISFYMSYPIRIDY